MDFRFTIETYLKELSLNPKIDLINNILSFLSDNIRTENAIGNELLIAKLFCRSIESLDQNSKLDIKTQNNIISANGMNLRKILFLKFVPLLLCLSY